MYWRLQAVFTTFIVVASTVHAATIYSVEPSSGSLAGGTMLTITGQGFQRGGIVGSTDVYVGALRCDIVDYYSDDTRLVCTTRMLHRRNQTANDRYRVIVGTYSYSATSFATCVDSISQCIFQYRDDSTPFIYRSTRAAHAGGELRFGGLLRSHTSASIDITIDGSKRCMLVNPYDVTDSDGNLVTSIAGRRSRRQTGSFSTSVGPTDVEERIIAEEADEDVPWEECVLPMDLTAGWYNYTVHVDPETGGPGYGNAQFVQRTPSTDVETGKDLVHADVNGESEHVLLIVPSIRSLSTRVSGVNGGQTIEVVGSGFDEHNCSNNVVHLAGVPCYVSSCTTNVISCTAQEYMQHAMPNGGTAGLRRKVWYQSVADWSQISTWPAPDLVENVIDGAIGKWENGRNRYTQSLEGYFIPPVTANYSFWVRGDDRAMLELDYLSSGMIQVAHTTSSTESYLVESAQKSAPIELFASRKYPMRAVQTEIRGGDHLQVAVEIHNVDRPGGLSQYHSVNEVQTLGISAGVRNQEIQIQVSNCGGGTLGIQHQQSVLPILLNGSSAAIAAATETAMRAVIEGCSRFAVTVVGAISSTRSLNISVIYRCPARIISGDQAAGTPARVEDWPLPFLVRAFLEAPAGATSDPLAESRILVHPSEPVSGTFQLGQHGLYTQPIPYSLTDVQVTAMAVRDALRQFPNVDDVRVVGAGTAQGAARFTLYFQTPSATNYPPLRVSLTGLTGENLSAAVDTLQQGDSSSKLFDPIPTYMTEVEASAPSATVLVNGINAACEGITTNGSNCSFSYDLSVTPVVTGLAARSTSLIAGDTLTISGINLLYSGAGVSVSFGGGDCNVESHNATRILCRLSHAVHGSHLPVVTVDHLGIATITPNVSAIEYGYRVDSVVPLSSGFRGGTLVTLTGTGFNPISSESNGITIGGAPCILAPTMEHRFNSVVCVAPAWANDSLPYMNHGDGSDMVVSLNVDFFGYANPAGFMYQWDLTPMISQLAPLQISAALSTRVTIVGGNWLRLGFVGASGDCSAAMWFESPSGERRMCGQLTLANENASCILPRGLPFPPNQQGNTMPMLRLCSADGRAVIAHTEPEYFHIDLGLRIDSVAPHRGSIAGGTSITVSGAGFSDLGARIVRSALTYNYLDQMTTVSVSLPDRSVPCLVTSSTFSEVVCTTIIPTTENATIAEDTTHTYRGDGYNGLVTVLVNDFNAPGCIDEENSSVSEDPDDATVDNWMNRISSGSWCEVNQRFCIQWSPELENSTSRIQFTMNGSTSGYLAVGFADDPRSMGPADVAMCAVSSSGEMMLRDRFNPRRGESSDDGDSGQDLTTLFGSTTETPPFTSCTFSRATDSTSSFDRSLSGSVINLIWAIGPPGSDAAVVLQSDTSTWHSARGYTELDIFERVRSDDGSALSSVRHIYNDSVVSNCGFNYANAATPLLFESVPAVGMGATAVTLIGSGFGEAEPIVTVGEVSCPVNMSNDTHIECTVPPLPAGRYYFSVEVPGYGLSAHSADFRDHVSFASLIHLEQISPRISSTVGGLVMTMTGFGFNPTLDKNTVEIGGAEAHVIHAQQDQLVVISPAQSGSQDVSVQVQTDEVSDYFFGQIRPTKFEFETVAGVSFRNGKVLLPSTYAVNTSDCADQSSCRVTYSQAYTPTMSSVSPSIGWQGTRIRMVGTHFDAGDDIDVIIGAEPCIVDLQTLSATSVDCIVGAVPAGVHRVFVTVNGFGTARSDATFESQLEINGMSASEGSFGGGTELTLSGRGFGGGESDQRQRRQSDGAWGGWLIYEEESIEAEVIEAGTKVHFCGAECVVTSSSYDSVSCTTTGIATPDAVMEFDHIEPVVLEPVSYVSSNSENGTASRAFDWNFETWYTGEWVGFDLGPDYLALVTRFRFFPKHQEAALMEGGVFQTRTTTSNWTTLARVASPHQGWNWVNVGDAAREPARFVRYQGPDGARSTITQLEVYGYQVKAASTCNATVSITETLSHPSFGPMVTSHNVTFSSETSMGFEYSTTQTGVVESIEPRFGSILGGEVLTIQGRNLATESSNTSVFLNGVECEVIVANETSVECVTGARGGLDRLRPASVVVTDHSLGRGTAVVNTSVRFRYLDRWSQLNTWLNDQPPVSGDTVIVPEDQAILLDMQPPRLFALIIHGIFVFDRRDLNLDASYILVQGGTLEVGTEKEPFLQTATITLHGDRRKSVELPFIGAKVLAVADKGGFTTHGEGRGVDVPLSQKGVLDIHGRPRLRTWTKCSEGTISAGSRRISTAEPTDFESGERIVLTAPRQELTVDNRIDAYTFTVVEAVTADHESEVRRHVGDGGDFELDMRCEVALLSRNVVIQGAGGPRADGSPTIEENDDEETSEAQLFGAHTGAFHGGHYRIENTELRHCGQAGVLGRYCIHFHVNDDNPPPHSYIYSNSIHHSFQRATTVHGTHHAVVRNNVAYHVMGHTYFVEDGDETFNTFDANIGIYTLPSHMMLKSDTEPATFWTAIPDNFWRNNVAVESSSRGAWFELTHQGTTLEFYNNSFHHNRDIGFRNYPNYSPPAPQYFYNNSYFRNGGNGLFYKKGGDNHHIFSKFAENGVDLFWKKYTTHATSRLIPNIQDCVFWGGTGSPAIFGPQHEYFYVNGSTFIDYNDAGVLSGCAGCCSQNSFRQGAYTIRFERLWWINSPRRTRWTCPYKQIFLDLDGSLTGYAGGTALPYYKFNEWDNHCVRSGDTYSLGWVGGGMICNSDVRVRRLQIRGQYPVDLDRIRISFKKSQSEVDANGIVTDSYGGVNWTKYHESGVLYNLPCASGNGASDWITADFSGCDVMDGLDWINYRVCNSDYSGWAVPIVTNHDFYADFDWHVDFQQLTMRWSEPYYLTEPYNLPMSSAFVSEPESILLRFPYVDYRYRFRVNYGGDYQHDTEVSWRDRNTTISTLSRTDDFGTGLILREDDSKRTTACCGEWHVSVNPWSGELDGNSSDPLQFDVQALQCGPNMCGLPGDIPEVWPDPILWSEDSTWTTIAGSPINTIDIAPTGRKPVEGESVEIPTGLFVIVDESTPSLDKLVVVGKLEFNGPRRIDVNRMLVWGILQIGESEQRPYPHNLQIVLHGVRTSPTLVATDQHFLGNKNLVVFGQLRAYGQAPRVSWTTLASTAAAGTSVLFVSDSVDWVAGQQLVVAPSEFTDPVDIWAQGPGFDMNDYRAHQQEERTIVNVYGSQITVDRPLNYRHFSGSVSTPRGSISLRAHVGLLSRNVVIRGDISDSPSNLTDNWYQGYGGHVVVGEVNYGTASDIRALRERGEILNTVQKLGSAVVSGVEFRDMGKLASEHGAFVFRFFSNLRPGQYPENRIENCAFASTWNHAVATERSFGLSISNNFIHKTFKSGIEIDLASRATTITNNLLIGNQRSPDDYDPSCEQDQSCWAHPFAAFMIWNRHVAEVSGNVAAGAEDTGFVMYPVDECGTQPRIHDNQAYGALVGLHLLDWAQTGCREVIGFTAWKNSHIGVVSVDQSVNLHLERIIVSDNHIGISLNFVQQGIHNFARIEDSKIVGSSDASTCGASSVCRAVTQQDVRGLRCGSVFGSQWRRVGLVMPQYTNLKKTCESGGLDVCRPPHTVFRMCSLPWETRFGNVDVQHAVFNMSRTAFANFRSSDCGLQSRAISLNPSQPDFVPVTYLSDLSWTNIDADAKMQLGETSNFRFVGEAVACRTSCDAVNYFRMHDIDGTTVNARTWWNSLPAGGISIHSSQNPPVIDPARCVYDSSTWTFACRDYHLSRMVLESNPPRFTKRRIGPVTVAKYGQDVSDNRTYWSVGPFPQGCSCQKHFAQFTFDVQSGQTYDIHSSGVLEDRNRVSFLSDKASDCIIARIFFSRPQPVVVVRASDNVQIDALDDGTLPSVSNLAHNSGTNVLDPQERMLYLKLCGGSEQQFWLTYEARVQITAVLDMSYDEFFANEEVGRERTERFVSNMADLLGISSNQIRVVCVHRIGEPCLRSRRTRRQSGGNSTSVDNGIIILVEVLPIMTTVENDATVSVSDRDRQVYLSELYYDFIENRTEIQNDFVSKGFPVTDLFITYDDLLGSTTSFVSTNVSSTVTNTFSSSTVSVPPVGSADESDSNISAVIGITVAVVAVFILLVAIAVIRRSRNEKKKQQPQGVWNTAFEATDSTWTPSTGTQETALDDSVTTPEEYDAENQPSYFAKKSRAELVQDSLFIKRPTVDDNAYFDISALPEDNERVCAIQHTNPDWQDQSVKDRARTVLKLAPVSPEEYRELSTNTSFASVGETGVEWKSDDTTA